MQLPPRGLTAWVLVGKLAAALDPCLRSVNSAQTSDHALVIGKLEAANSLANRLGAILGHCVLLLDTLDVCGMRKVIKQTIERTFAAANSKS